MAAALVLPGCIIDKFPTVTDSETGTTAGTSDGSTSGGTTSGGATEAPTTGSTGAVTLCPEHAQADACCCFEHEMSEGGFGNVSNVCGATELCPAIEVDCEGDLDGSCPAVDVEANLDCALQALAADTPGSLSARFLGSPDGYPSRSILYYVVAGGEAYRIMRTTPNETSSWEATGRFARQPASFFTDCLAKTIAEKTACVRQALVGDALEVCVEAFVSQDVF